MVAACLKIFPLKGCIRAWIGYIGRVMKFFLMTLGVAGGLFISCERQEFEGPNGTKQLHEPHGAAGAGHGADAAAEPGTAHGAKEAKDVKDEATKPSH